MNYWIIKSSAIKMEKLFRGNSSNLKLVRRLKTKVCHNVLSLQSPNYLEKGDIV